VRSTIAPPQVFNFRFRDLGSISPAAAQCNFSVVLTSLQGSYSFNRFLTSSSLIQLDTPNTQAFSANVRLRYNYRPDSDLYPLIPLSTNCLLICGYPERASSASFRQPPANS
jgi:hypothetical protein